MLYMGYFRTCGFFYLSFLRVAFVAGDVVIVSLLTGLEYPFISIGSGVGPEVASFCFCLPRRSSPNFQAGGGGCRQGVSEMYTWQFQSAELFGTQIKITIQTQIKPF